MARRPNTRKKSVRASTPKRTPAQQTRASRSEVLNESEFGSPSEMDDSSSAASDFLRQDPLADAQPEQQDDESIVQEEPMELTPSRAGGRVSVTQSVSETLDNASPQPGTSRQSAAPPRRKSAPAPKRRRKQAAPKKNQHRWLQEVRRLQKSTSLLIPKLPFARVVREVLQTVAFTPDLKVTREALMALHESAEMYLTYFFQDANRLALHAKRVTLMPRDLQLIYNLRTNWAGCSY